jgi:hypothetical protein
MGMMMVVVMAAGSAGTHRLRQILHIRKLTALRGAGEIRGQLIELARRGGIAVGGSSLRRTLQVGGDLLRHLLILRGVGLLELLQRTHQLSKG